MAAPFYSANREKGCRLGTIVRWLRQAHQIILKLSDHHAILLTFYVVDLRPLILAS